MHLLWQRKIAEEDRAKFKAQTSILQDLIEQLRSDKPMSNEEIVKLRNLARIHGEGSRSQDNAKAEIGWLDVVWGRKSPADVGVSDEWERKDLERSELVPCHPQHPANCSAQYGEKSRWRNEAIVSCIFLTSLGGYRPSLSCTHVIHKTNKSTEYMLLHDNY